MPVHLIRHTRPIVADGICYGQTDLELAATFRSEATEVIKDLPEPKCLVTSPLKRCRHLAELIGEVSALPAIVDSRVQEMSFGSWEGQPWSDIPRSELDEWAEDFMHARPHGGESVAMFRCRVHDALADYRKSGKEYIVVTHAGVIRASLSDGDLVEDWAMSVDFGALITLK